MLLFSEFKSEILSLAGCRDAGLHPCRHGFALEVMVEELLQADGEVLGVAPLAEVVGLVVVFEQPGGMAEAAQGHEEFDALVPRHCTVVVVVHDKDGRGDVLGVEYRGILDIEVQAALVPEGRAYAALAVLILHGADKAGLPAYASVRAGHVADGGSGPSRGEHVGARHEVRSLVSSPALALDGHAVLVDEGELLAHGFGAGADAVVRALSRVSVHIDDVGDEHHVAAAGVEREVHRRAARGGGEVGIQLLGILLVEVHDHRVFLVRVEVFRGDQHSVEGSAVIGVPVDQAVVRPVVFGLLGVDRRPFPLAVPAVGSGVHVGGIVVIALAIDVKVGVLCLGDVAEGVFVRERGLQAGLLDADRRDAVLLGLAVEHGEEDVALAAYGLDHSETGKGRGDVVALVVGV